MFGNLGQQDLNGGATRETYSYDAVQRLTAATRTGGASGTVDYAYDAIGNLTSKSDFSTTVANAYAYTGGSCGGGPNAVKSVALKAGGTRTYCYDAAGNMTGDNASLSVRYDHTQRPLKIARGTVTQSFDYAPSGERFREWGTDGEVLFFGKLERRFTPTAQDKLYAASNAVVTQTGATRTVQYLLTDRLGSVDAIAYPSGTLVETRGYDAFGKPRTGTWADATPPRLGTTANTPHGFTGHEHLNSLELIHMNGRVYDYNLGRFMEVDPIIQSPLNSQSLNPYSYIGNNPLSGTDPTGYAVCTGSHIDRDDGSSCDQQGVWTTVINAPKSPNHQGNGANNGAQRTQSVTGSALAVGKEQSEIGKSANNANERYALSKTLDAMYHIERTKPMSVEDENKLDSITSIQPDSLITSEANEGLASFLYRVGKAWRDRVQATGFEYRSNIGFDVKEQKFAISLGTNGFSHVSLDVGELPSSYTVIDVIHNHGLGGRVNITDRSDSKLMRMASSTRDPKKFLETYREPYLPGSIGQKTYPGGLSNQFSPQDFHSNSGWLVGDANQFIHHTSQNYDFNIAGHP